MPDDKIQLIPARVAHNRRLMDEYLDRNKAWNLFPPAEEQHESKKITGIFDGGYNPSIARYKGNLVMAYRYHHDGTASTRLAICDLDENLNVLTNRAFELNEQALSQEDPRLFFYENNLWMSYVASEWPHFPVAKVRYVRLSKPDHWRADHPIDYSFPNMEAIEKNHTPLFTPDGLGIIYRHNPKMVVYVPRRTEPVVGDSLTWAYGEIRGGTAPIPYNGKLLKFFHSSLRNDMPPQHHRYYIGALVFNPEPPFNMVAVSKKPILFGSEGGGEKNRKHFKPKVVFPAGVVADRGGFQLSVGVNDSECRVFKIREEELHL
jgi:predicted GH43/DUF377 family glycosyl hydrolase